MIKKSGIVECLIDVLYNYDYSAFDQNSLNRKLQLKLFYLQAGSQLLVPMIPLGLKETKEIELQEPFKV